MQETLGFTWNCKQYMNKCVYFSFNYKCIICISFILIMGMYIVAINELSGFAICGKTFVTTIALV